MGSPTSPHQKPRQPTTSPAPGPTNIPTATTSAKDGAPPQRSEHNQYIPNPLAHFSAIPWAARLLRDPAVSNIVVSERQPLASGDKRLVRETLNGATTVRACVTFVMHLPTTAEEEVAGRPPLSKSKALLRGGGPKDGEDPARPFLLFNALLDLGEDLCGYRGTLHGGAFAVLLDETMCAAADNQSQFAFTASLKVDFKKPVKLPGVVLVRSRVVKKEGRKIYVRGTIENEAGECGIHRV
ncbi:HotDog domain-containing protein [Dichotomopilus funicola]|uniref:HotDog domain-containing protein n=1 Tax=Dichotomopilus funicola TaxID=1934379 RepID=A0AAN6VAY4_9PEZI|nr:HotDog domain-containing protein [Dichotomopilus funicola]